MRVLITGPEGFIARNLTRAILHDGRIGMVTEIREADAVIHLDAIPGVAQCKENPEGSFRRNVTQTNELLTSCTVTGVDRFVFASSAAAAQPYTVYGAHKAAGEALCKAFRHSYGLKTVVLRFGNVYGPFSARKTSVVSSMMKALFVGNPIVVHGDGSQTRDFVFVDDVVRAIVRALTSPPGSYYVGPKSPMSVNDLVRTIEAANGGPAVTKDGQARTPRDLDSAPETALPWLPGWEPTVGLEEGIGRTYSWFRRHAEKVVA